MIRVLHVFHELENGGTGQFVMNYYRNIDRNAVQFDFLTSVDEAGYYDEEIKSLGGKILHAYPLHLNPIRNYLDIARIVRENQYQIVHRHTGSAFGYFDLRAARYGGAHRLILHAHNTEVGKPFIHQISRGILKIKCTRFACSQEAGHFLFGKNAMFDVIPNAIDVSCFTYNPVIRQQIRNQYKLGHRLVIGHVGRFQEQKNHQRLLRIFAEIHRNRPDSVLICVGDGEKMNETKKSVRLLELESCVLFVGQRNDVNHILQAIDVFLFPSLWEGFGIAILEAQASGLPCFVSKDVIPESVNVTGNTRFISLNENDENWAKSILACDLARDLTADKKVALAGYDIKHEAEKLQSVYEHMMCSA